ncbi:MAG: hypothetical protein Q8R40_01445 [bacterium]|nr:hypothetical protein [bacterium]
MASFVDIQKNKLISEDLVVTIRIAQLDGATKKEFVYEKDNILIHGGVFEFPYTFITTGLHEVFFDFAFTSRPEKVYEAPDFLIDIQPKAKELLPQISLILFAVGVTTGALITWIFTVRKKIKNV